MCIDAPESTTNSRSSGLRFDAGRHLFSEGEKNAVLFFSFNFRTLLASFHAASRAPSSCHSVSSWDRSSNFGALGSGWWGSPGQTIPSEGFWSRVSAWRNTASVNRTHRIGVSMFDLFRKIDEDFGGSTQLSFDRRSLADCCRCSSTCRTWMFSGASPCFQREPRSREWRGSSSRRRGFSTLYQR